MYRLITIIILLFNSYELISQSRIEYGKLTDIRDDKEYLTIQIGEQVWMAENLSIGKHVDNCGQTNNNIIEKTCYDNEESNCDISGGLYTWDEMMSYSNIEGAQGICPEGWHVPTKSDWEELNNFLGPDSSGHKMKVDESYSPKWDGNNISGFTAIPSGVAYKNGFSRRKNWAVYWSSTESENDKAYFAQLDNFWYPSPPKYLKLYIGDYYLKVNAFAVRCIKN